MSKFASISKKLIIKALGRQANYIEEVTGDIDIEASGCLSCPVYLKNSGTDSAFMSECDFCEHKVYCIKKKYINEKNRFRVDDRLRLKANAIKILLYLHFQNPDQNGIVKNVKIKALSELLKVEPRTIINNLMILCDYGYICYCKVGSGIYNIMIDGYKEQFEKRGPGYLVVNEEWLMFLLKAGDINSVRICIRETMQIDNLNAKGGYFYNTVESSYDSIKRYLPGYCKPWKIRKTLEKNCDVFNGVFNYSVVNGAVRFTLKDSCAAKKSRDILLSNYMQDIRSFIDALNSYVNLSVTDTVEDERFAYMNLSDSTIPSIRLSQEQIDNLAHLAIQYDYISVENALINIHACYLMKGERVENVGGLVRSIIEKSLNAYIA